MWVPNHSFNGEITFMREPWSPFNINNSENDSKVISQNVQFLVNKRSVHITETILFNLKIQREFYGEYQLIPDNISYLDTDGIFLRYNDDIKLFCYDSEKWGKRHALINMSLELFKNNSDFFLIGKAIINFNEFKVYAKFSEKEEHET